MLCSRRWRAGRPCALCAATTAPPSTLCAPSHTRPSPTSLFSRATSPLLAARAPPAPRAPSAPASCATRSSCSSGTATSATKRPTPSGSTGWSGSTTAPTRAPRCWCRASTRRRCSVCSRMRRSSAAGMRPRRRPQRRPPTTTDRRSSRVPSSRRRPHLVTTSRHSTCVIRAATRPTWAWSATTRSPRSRWRPSRRVPAFWTSACRTKTPPRRCATFAGTSTKKARWITSTPSPSPAVLFSPASCCTPGLVSRGPWIQGGVSKRVKHVIDTFCSSGTLTRASRWRTPSATTCWGSDTRPLWTQPRSSATLAPSSIHRRHYDFCIAVRTRRTSPTFRSYAT